MHKHLLQVLTREPVGVDGNGYIYWQGGRCFTQGVHKISTNGDGIDLFLLVHLIVKCKGHRAKT